MNQTKSVHAGRHWYLDMLRIAATILIVCEHALPYVFFGDDVSSANWKLLNAISIFCRWGVPVFYMISGALFLAPEKPLSVGRLYKKTILRMVASFFSWSAFYALAYCLTYDKGKWTFLNRLLRGEYHMWFLFSIVGLYILTPLLRKITESKRATQYFLITSFALSFVLGRLLNFLTVFDFPHADVLASLRSAYLQTDPFRSLTAVFYFLLGHYLHAYPLGKIARRFAAAAALCGYCLTVMLTSWHSGLIGSISARFYGSESLGVCLMSAGVFLLFRHGLASCSPQGRLKSAVLTLSKCSFGVYLVHTFILERIGAQYSLDMALLPMLLKFLAVSAAACLLSFLISFLLNRIPVVRKYMV